MRKAEACSGHPPLGFLRGKETWGNRPAEKSRPWASLIPTAAPHCRGPAFFPSVSLCPFLGHLTHGLNCIARLTIWSQASLCPPPASICVSLRHLFRQHTAQPRGGSQVFSVSLPGPTTHPSTQLPIKSETQEPSRAPSPPSPHLVGVDGVLWSLSPWRLALALPCSPLPPIQPALWQ